MDGETIATGFKLIRDVVIFTDKRILTFDKQGATGQKMRVSSINLQSVYFVTAETAGFGLDDSELTIHYITSPYLKAHSITVDAKKFEFPKKYNIQQLYKMLQENCIRELLPNKRHMKFGVRKPSLKRMIKARTTGRAKRE